jgi:DNA-binding NarL/FixJ family response regulator
MQNSPLSGHGVVNILIAESSKMNCQLIESALRPKRHHLAVVARAIDSAHALNLLSQTKPDVALVSLQLDAGPLEGHHLLREIRGMQLRTRVVMLLTSRDPGVVIDTFRSGAHGVVFRDEPLETLCKCIHAVHQGQVWANSQQLGYLLEALTRALPLHLRDAHGINLLAKHEEDVVRLVAEGMTNREVSRKLELSEHTVRNYLCRVFDKLGVSSRVELVLYCLQERQRDSKRPEAAGA